MELLKKTPRIEVVDALRGFAVMAILLVHNLEHFIFPVYPESSPEWLSVLDAGVFNAIFSLSPCFSDLLSISNRIISS